MVTLTATGLMCLALTVYHEARSATVTGQRAVALVVMNRAEGDPDRVCEEVFKPRQFSWANDRAWLKGRRIKMLASMMPKERESWRLARVVALKALTGVTPDFTRGATHYHMPTVSPAWARNRRELDRIGFFGPHIFYRPARSSVIADYNERVSVNKRRPG